MVRFPGESVVYGSSKLMGDKDTWSQGRAVFSLSLTPQLQLVVRSAAWRAKTVSQQGQGWGMGAPQKADSGAPQLCCLEPYPAKLCNEYLRIDESKGARNRPGGMEQSSMRQCLLSSVLGHCSLSGTILGPLQCTITVTQHIVP